MLDRIHAGRVTEFRRVLRTCAIAVSAGRHGLVLRVPQGQDPDGFARAFHRHCRERAGRPVRILGGQPGNRPCIRRLADLLGLEGPAVSPEIALPDLLGARERWFERLRAALAADLATDGVSTGPGLLIIEGDFRDSPTLAAFLSFLCPGASPWTSMPSVRPRTEQFAVVAVVALPDRVAVIVPAEKFPAASRLTIALPTLPLVAVLAALAPAAGVTAITIVLAVASALAARVVAVVSVFVVVVVVVVVVIAAGLILEGI